MWDKVLSMPRDFLFQSIAKPEFGAESPSRGTAAIRCTVKVTLGTAPAAQPENKAGWGPGGTRGSLCKADHRLLLHGHVLGSQICSGTETSFQFHAELQSLVFAMSRPISVSGHWVSRAAHSSEKSKEVPPGGAAGLGGDPTLSWTWPGDRGAIVDGSHSFL